MRKSKNEVLQQEWTVDGLIIPIRIFAEPRRFNWRVSIASQSIIMRFPTMVWHKASQACLDWGMTWIRSQMIKSPHLFTRFKKKSYYSGKVISTCFGSYNLILQSSNDNSAHCRTEKDAIVLNLPESMDQLSKNKSIPSLISTSLVARHKQDFTNYIAQINQDTFQFKYNRITLRYTHHRWGSCSIRKNLNFSTRLFLAPDPVIKYIIIHELAHLQHYDHSRRFWSLIHIVMPEYQKWNKWIRVYGPMLQF